MEQYRRPAELLLHARYAIALTGAGISVESGIPDFRGKDGLWARYDPMEYAHIDSFRRNPAKVWNMLAEMDELIASVQPNDAHRALAVLEKLGVLRSVVTQNIDSLHQRAGSRDVVEFHGNFRTFSCDECYKGYARDEVSLEKRPPLCKCGGPLRPDIVFFGEGIPEDAHVRAVEAAGRCDLMLVIGTSASVVPASYLPRVAKSRGATIIEINPSLSELSAWATDEHVMEPAAGAMRGIMAAIAEINPDFKDVDR
jgi:NAD-dependent deacetylase